jgi:hypothetical protein
MPQTKPQSQESPSAPPPPRQNGHPSADQHSAEDGQVSADGHGLRDGHQPETDDTATQLIDVAALLAENDGLRQRLASQPVIEQAKGILMGYYRINADTAFQLLRRWSQDSNAKVRRIAELLTDTTTQAPGEPAAPHEIATRLWPQDSTHRHPTQYATRQAANSDSKIPAQR